ncbi:transcriptional regulator [Halopenitus sp. H-Gu1]|uniref:transcriptional regulator n=1 Tax=Halopenitus sp. H-Gu1 TaxID=3242697 RepID=UPI00359E2224
MERTTRQRIADRLRETDATASDLSETVSRPRSVVYEHLEHVAASLDDDEQFLVVPPRCRECGFDDFDDPITLPSRCPECRSERIDEPIFRIE